ncbi:MAG TPA: tetratricopeptide repeat protein [Kofleriaceae bacterium]|nr:tetratricopeptide repeat protein [Kofleriaceae bacterium]
MVAPWRTLALAIAFTLLPAVVRADAPWSQGVTEEQKAKAKVLLDQGNALLLDKKYVEALDKYTEAVAAWDHPAIRFNMVRCQIQLGKNLEAYENLEKALKYGAEPLEETVYNEALAYQKLLETQIGDIQITCKQDGVKLTIDGQPLATCPAQESRRLLAGPHQIVGNKAGLLPKTMDVVVVGGKPLGVDVKLDPLAAGAKIVHRWPGYIPWTIAGAGLGLAAIGGVTLWAAHNQMEAYDAFVRSNCTGQCDEAQTAQAKHDYYDPAKTKNSVGGVTIVVGAAAFATGAVMVYLNRGRTVYPDVAPLPGGGGAVSLSGSF